jgi:hypothetical protein
MHLCGCIRTRLTGGAGAVWQERHPAISLRRTDSFGTLIAKIASTAVHRYARPTNRVYMVAWQLGVGSSSC